MCRLPWSRHHSALALSRRPAEALPSSLVSARGDGGEDLGWDGEGHPPPSLSLCLSVLKTGLDPRKCLVLGPGGGGRYQRTLGASLASPQMSIFLRLCSVQGAPLGGVPEPALHKDTGSSIPWPALGSWHGPPSLGEGGISFLAIPCSQSCSPLPPWGREWRGRTLQDWEDSA